MYIVLYNKTNGVNLPATFIDLTGKTFHLLTVIKIAYKVRTKNKFKTYWNCICKCGNLHVTEGQSLRSGTTKSCGCYKLTYRKSTNPKMVSAYAVYNHAGMYSSDGITFDDFLILSQQLCYYCGTPPSNRVNKVAKGRRNYDDYWFTYNGLDRVDNTKGHTLENCVPCCFMCNAAKSSKTKQQFLNWIEKVYKYSIMK